MIIIGAIVLIGALFWIWTMLDLKKRTDVCSDEAFARMLEAENSTWRYDYTEETITSGSPVIKE